MRLSVNDLASLACGASTPEERLDQPFVLGDPREHAGVVDMRVARWADVAAQGDGDRLRRSLAWRGVDLDRMRASLAPASLADGALLPGWTERLARLVGNMATAASLQPGGVRFIFDEDLIACQWVAAPFIVAASARLLQELPPQAGQDVTEAVFVASERALLVRLAPLFAGALADAWSTFSFSDSWNGGDPESRDYRFATSQLARDEPGLFLEYPVLARLVTATCDHWHDATIEILTRLAADRALLVDRFNQGNEPGRLAALSVGDADVHDGHRQVVILTFEDGLRVVYKPRAVELDAAFDQLLRWLNERGFPHPLRSPSVVCGEGYGWCEFVEHRAARDEAALSRFYFRAGGLVALAHLLGSTDLHAGNIIAAGDCPVPIDLETLLAARPRNADGLIVSTQRSVLDTLLLPSWSKVHGTWGDLTALGAPLPPAVAPDIAFTAVPSLPTAGEAIESLLMRHGPEVEAGFEVMYRLLVRERAALAEPTGPLAALKRGVIRVVMRNTWLYAALLARSLEPSSLREAADRSVELERLHHTASVEDAPPAFLPMIARELECLQQMDIPRFCVEVDDTALRDSKGCIATGVMARSPFEELQQRLAALGESDLVRQRNDIRHALVARSVTPPASRLESAQLALAASPSPSSCIDHACAIAGELLRTSFVDSHGLRHWQGLGFLADARRYAASPDLGGGFADGGMGIAVFFAALHHLTGDTNWRGEAIALARMHLDLELSGHVDGVRRARLSGGLARGMGGLLLGASLVASLLRDEEPAALGAAVIARYARGMRRDATLDLYGGVAGTALGLSAMIPWLPVPERSLALELIQRDAVRLSSECGNGASGLLTGRAGVVLALHLVASDRQAQMGVLAQGLMPDWAEGSCGIAVAMLAQDAESAQGIACLRNIADAAPSCVDGVAFGSAGEADALLWAAARTGLAEFETAARRRLGALTVLREAKARSRLLHGVDDQRVQVPGLFHGLAGIGYVLLRFAGPGRLPSLAALEVPNHRRVL